MATDNYDGDSGNYEKPDMEKLSQAVTDYLKSDAGKEYLKNTQPKYKESGSYSFSTDGIHPTVIQPLTPDNNIWGPVIDEKPFNSPSPPPLFKDKIPPIVMPNPTILKDVAIYEKLSYAIKEVNNYFRSDVKNMFIFNLFKNRVSNLIQGMSDLGLYEKDDKVFLNVVWYNYADGKIDKLLGNEDEIAASWNVVKDKYLSKKEKKGNSQIVYMIDNLKQVKIYKWGFKIISEDTTDMVGVFPGFSNFGKNFDETFTSNQIKVEVNECMGEEFDLPHELAMSKYLIGYWAKKPKNNIDNILLSDKKTDFGMRNYNMLDI